MTTSYSETSTTSLGQTPTYSAEGYQVWKPEVGIVHKPAFPKGHSYGGVIGALQDLQADSGNTVKSYPENFAGIIAAIKDLSIAASDGPGSDTGDKPPGLEIIINPNTGLPEYIYPIPPENGELWFDTRQGRLFVWVEDDWYQTNGADGLPIVTAGATAPEMDVAVPGQFWWDSLNNDLYIHDGLYDQGQPVWKLVTDGGSGAFQSTRTLPLAKTSIQPRAEGLTGEILPPIDLENMNTQENYNDWLYLSLKSLEEVLEEFNPVTIDPILNQPPDDPVPGQLWFDTDALELSIWYEDDDSGQWVPTSVAYSYDSDLETIRYDLAQETKSREQGLHAVHQRLDEINVQDLNGIRDIQNSLKALQTTVDQLPSYNLSLYQTAAEAEADKEMLNTRISSLNIPTINHLAVESEVNQELAQLQAQINQLPTHNDIPNVNSFVTQSHIDQTVADYMPRTGGTLTGSFVIEKEDIGLPAFDVSANSGYSNQLFKLQSYNSASQTTTFGATSNWWEIAWDFAGHEDFAWIYNDTDKVFSITKEGPACSALYIGTFDQNDSNGRKMGTNTIEVGQVLRDIKVAASSSTDFATFKSKLLTALAKV